MRSTACRRVHGSLTAGVVLCICASCLLASQASWATPLRRAAVRLTGLATDYERWVAWEVAGQNTAEVLDVKNGHLRKVPMPEPCLKGFPNGRESTSGMLFLPCDEYLNARTGQIGSLPNPDAVEWNRIGTRYAEGRPAHCPLKNCVSMLDLATGTVSLRTGPQLFDLDRPGAPAVPICPGLRERVLSYLTQERGVGGLYESGAFVDYGDRLNTVQINRCDERPIVLRTTNPKLRRPSTRSRLVGHGGF